MRSPRWLRCRVRRGCAGLLVGLLAISACSDDGGGLCDQLAGAEFQSEGMISAIETEDGVVRSPEFLDFTANDVDWLISDVVETGEWTCRGDRVSSFNGRFGADLLEEDGRLLLDRDGVRYLERS